MVVIAGLGGDDDLTVHLNGSLMTQLEKTVRGSLYGSLNPHYDIVKLLRLYDAGRIKLAEIATRHYRLDQVNQGLRGLEGGRSSSRGDYPRPVTAVFV